MQYQQLRTLPDFDVLRRLARQDPRALENLRQRLTNDVIRRARSQRSRARLEGLQFTIDLERRRTRDPLAACVKISRMMHESLATLNRVLVETADSPTEPLHQGAAQVLAFERSPQDV